MIPERRLTNLLHEVKQSWIGNCLYHNTAASPSLYVDHTCDRSDFPSKPALELNRHRNEVWFLKYSHNGNMLASGSRDSSVIIYDTTSPTYKVLHELKEHQAGITYLAWSPDDTKLVTCSRERENVAKIWDTRVSGHCFFM